MVHKDRGRFSVAFDRIFRLEKKAAKADETVDNDWRRSPFRKITTTDLLDNSDLEKFILIKPLILAEGKTSPQPYSEMPL